MKIAGKMKNCIRKGVLGSDGIAMTEVVIAFLLLTIIFGIMYNCIRFASNMMMRAKDTDSANAKFEEVVSQKFAKSAVADPYNQAGINELSATPASVGFKVEGGNTYNLDLKPAYMDISFDIDGTPETRKVYLYKTN